MAAVKPQSKTFLKGDVIFREGEKGNAAYMIQSGTVNIVKNIKGKRQILATLGPGELFGEMAIISKCERVAGAEAASECVLLELTARLILLLLKKSHPTVFHLTRVLASRLARADRAVSESRSDNSWLTFCRLLHMKHRIFETAPKTEDAPIGITLEELSCEYCEITNGSQHEVERHLKSAIGFNMISVNKIASQSYLTIINPDDFLEIAKNLSEDINKFSGKVFLSDFIDIHDFSSIVDSNPEMIYKKIGVGDFPEDICMLHKEATSKWVEKKGAQYFKETKRKRKSIDELEGVEDIIFVDIGTLKLVFRKLGYYKLGILLAIAGDDAKKRILAAISTKIAAAITRDSRSSDAIDQSEADDVEEELIDMIREIKSSKKE
ncbi:cyclic nucleotide-binding domain-containing protein [Maridesulfovibrio salexigens]|uniref:Putative transcriptional regulator, Crp/Fnr family n=1 Tax=Maridesulfovibrio salexigens (strain ATCC 14822 / DSM 2638 / NCIMB 8403 / VKM B-1763) TaxID=526222 RepID=C6BVC4_MARSD|nr:cyclic nucleotide-binding domain-containing protein [Maridesulfovibrio salexigens]ACS80099.1 putative transcriptional regulator, Crp/Fnr family [Maridesulfovibrio salexigens DSM 2638]